MQASRLAAVLSESVNVGAQQCARLLPSGGETIPVGLSRAASLARTLTAKYDAAIEKGHRVDGLAETIASLRLLDSETPVRGVHLDEEGSSFYSLVLTEHLDRVIGILHVVPKPQ